MLQSIVSDFSVANNDGLWAWIGSIGALVLVLLCTFGPSMLTSMRTRNRRSESELEFRRTRPELPSWIDNESSQ